MRITETRDRERLARFLCQHPGLHFYALGDLDETYFPHTRWFVLEDGRQFRALGLMYTAYSEPVLHLLAPQKGIPSLKRLAAGLLPQLPPAVYTHLSPGLEELFQQRYALHSRGWHWKMVLAEPERAAPDSTLEVIRLTEQHLSELLSLYENHYPAHAFEPRQLATGQFFGVFRQGQLVCAAGVHVFSPAYRVAAVGNVVTHRAYRGQGLAARAAARLIHSLREETNLIGLNVQINNLPAVALYQKLGFKITGVYAEISLQEKQTP